MFQKISLSNKRVKHDTTIVLTTSMTKKVGVQMGIKQHKAAQPRLSFGVIDRDEK